MTSIRLDICGITAEIKLISSNNCYNKIKNRYHKFLGYQNKHKPNIIMALKSIRLSHNNLLNKATLINEYDKTLIMKGGGFYCRLSNRNGCWEGGGIINENIFQFDSLLRLIWSQILLLSDGFLIHAFGTYFNTKGYLFPGASGSGKTTMAKKSPYSSVLSDEVVGVRIIKGKPYIMGTPFWGEFQEGGQPVHYPLCGIYFLKKNKTVELEPLIKPLAMKRILKLILFFGRQSGYHEVDKSIVTSGIQKLLNIINQYLTKIPTYQISLAKNTRYETIMRIISQH
jgi:hypothetical protein